jgi:hypothetical protein
MVRTHLPAEDTGAVAFNQACGATRRTRPMTVDRSASRDLRRPTNSTGRGAAHRPVHTSRGLSGLGIALGRCVGLDARDVCGDGFKYLRQSVAAGDGHRSLTTPLIRYYAEKVARRVHDWRAALR